MAFARIGPEFLVNTTTSGSQSQSTTTALADGRFLVIWTDFSQTNGDISGNSVRGRIFNADGTQSVPEFLINAVTLSDQFQGSVTVLADGRFVVTWSDFSHIGADTTGYAVRGRIFNANGTQSVAEFLVNTTTTSSQFESKVTALTDGRFVVTWSDFSQSGGDASDVAVRGRIFNADGTQSVAEFLVNTTTAGPQQASNVTALAGGRFVVTWSDNSQSGGDTSFSAVRARIFNANGTVAVPEFLVNTTTTSGQNQSSVATLADGRFVVTWNDNSGTGGDTSGTAVRGRIFNANGTQSVPEFLVNTTTAGTQFDSSVTALADGRFVVTWSDLSLSGGDASGSAVRAQVFAANGNKSGGEFLVNTTTGNAQSDSYVTALPDGRFVVTWTDDSVSGSDASLSAIRSQIFDPIQYNGGAAVDTVIGGNFADTINGGGGNDILGGGGGGDFLFGGIGNDRLNGGAGIDTMTGGDGSDAYVVDVFNDVVTETNVAQATGGNDFVFFNGTVGTFTLGLNVERLTLGGASAINGTGNALNNAIIGNGVSNIINGRFGNDTLTGGAGADFFVFNSTPNSASNRDTITDFNVADDTIRLDHLTYTALGVGALTAGAFNTGTAATQADDRIIYNTTTGALLYDADGLGGAAGIQFATLTGLPAITAADFIVV
jgi:hypothetical protein